MAKVSRISRGKEYIIVTVDDGGAYIIKDMKGKKVFLSKRQAMLMKFGIENVLKDAIGDSDGKDIKVEELAQ